MNHKVDKKIKSNFGLKETLIQKQSNNTKVSVVGLQFLEDLRTSPSKLFTSKNGLEVICGSGSDVGSM